MRHRTVTAVFGFAFVVSVAWITLRSDSFVLPLAKEEPATKVRQIAGAEEVSPKTPFESAPISSIEQAADGIALQDALVSDLAAKLYGNFNSPFVEFLVSRGLSRQDGERVIGGAFHVAATCWFAAVRAQAQSEGRSFDPVFEIERGALSNARNLNQLSASCINSALEQVGVNPPLGIRATDV
jgi:hypothetical protein